MLAAVFTESSVWAPSDIQILSVLLRTCWKPSLRPSFDEVAVKSATCLQLPYTPSTS